MVRKRLTLLIIILILSFSSNVFAIPMNERLLIVDGEQHGISYQIFKTNEHYVIRFYKEEENIFKCLITELEINLEIENGKLLSVAPTGKLENNRSTYKFSSRKGLNKQLEDKGVFLIFKFIPEENCLGKLTFSITEYTSVSKTSVTRQSNLITFSLQ
ncbi:hypothetical protein [Anaerobranca gottschalkii]|uniref:Uncharacterized protein n=1 Tax=Anaerobranca gottschalkii DSM 13577 TaxID=1120990 RepID=A0A1H9Z4L1_9FIRM|nr:hypothetical protein [Anaerobranca gottschalkii]SES76438.1 hypothetical protein SAMN03080614_100674 [Anaerobranca gottschalkii DSM 13577]